MNLQGGIAFGMNVRVGVTNMISFETGIGQVDGAIEFSAS